MRAAAASPPPPDAATQLEAQLASIRSLALHLSDAPPSHAALTDTLRACELQLQALLEESPPDAGFSERVTPLDEESDFSQESREEAADGGHRAASSEGESDGISAASQGEGRVASVTTTEAEVQGQSVAAVTTTEAEVQGGRVAALTTTKEVQGENVTAVSTTKEEVQGASIAATTTSEAEVHGERATAITTTQAALDGESGAASDWEGVAPPLATATATLTDEIFRRPQPHASAAALHLADDLFRPPAALLRDHTRPLAPPRLAEDGGQLRNSIFDDLLRRPPPPPPPSAAAPPPPSPSDAAATPHHLLFLVHGIGRHDDFADDRLVGWDGGPRRCGGNHEFRAALEKAADGPLAAARPRLAVRAIEWHSVLHDGRGEALLAACAPPGVGDLRGFTRSTVMDVLYYAAPPHGQRIVDAVAEALNAKHAAFVAERPGWRGGVSIAAHSLGSVLCADLLMHAGTTARGVRYPTLAFHVDCFFAFGSPVPLFLISRLSHRPAVQHGDGGGGGGTGGAAAGGGEEGSGGAADGGGEGGAPGGGERKQDGGGEEGGDGEPRLPRCRSFFNVVNPIDPIAYLCAPLLGPSPPPLDAEGGIDAAVQHSQRVEAMKQPPKELPTLRAIAPGASFDEVVRYLRSHDWRTHRPGEVVDAQLPHRFVLNETLFSLRAHSSYFLSEEVALFTLTQLLVPWARAPHAAPSPSLRLDVRLAAASELHLRSEITGRDVRVVALLQSGCLFVLPDEARWLPQPRGELRLRGATVAPRGGRGGTLAVTEAGTGRVYELDCKAAEEAAEWAAAVEEAVRAADGGEAEGGGGRGVKGWEGDGRLGFFGAARSGLLLKRGSITRAWKQRWFALCGGALQCYNRPPLVEEAVRAVDVRRATLRLHEASGQMSWALEGGELIQLFAAEEATMRVWADVCEGFGIAVDRHYQPRDLNLKERPTA
ncbi:hypothetical protein AB1Y20_020412 [Prymnesium parvum]|uniref:DDHD domain-containing protein n=1 Tax=Prymnesium parvum TaxID=97485 RepID=A0AB34JXI5_PRYPA